MAFWGTWNVSAEREGKMGRRRGPESIQMLALAQDWEPGEELRAASTRRSLKEFSLLPVTAAIQIDGADEFSPTLVRIRLSESSRIAAGTGGVFRLAEGRAPMLLHDSGVNTSSGVAWAVIDRPGTYFAAALQHDLLLRQIIWWLASERSEESRTSLDAARRDTKRLLRLIEEMDNDELSRAICLMRATQTAVSLPAPTPVVRGLGGTVSDAQPY